MAPEMGMSLDYQGPCVIKGSHKRVAGGSESEMEEAALLVVKMKGGATSQGCGARRSWKKQEVVLPWSLWKDQPRPHVG